MNKRNSHSAVTNALQAYRASPRTSQDKLRFAKAWLKATYPSKPAKEDRELLLWQLVEYMTTIDFMTALGNLTTDKIDAAHEVMTEWEKVILQIAAADERDGLSAEEKRALLSHIRNAAVILINIDVLDDLTKLLSIDVPEGFRERVLRDIAAHQHGEELQLDPEAYAFLGGSELYDDAHELVGLVEFSEGEIDKNHRLFRWRERQRLKHPSWCDLPDYAGMSLEIHGPADERVRREVE